MVRLLKLSISFFLVWLLLPQTISAQENIRPQNYNWSEYSFATEHSVKLKKPNTAIWISVGSTVASAYLISSLRQVEDYESFTPALTIFLLSTAPATGYLYTNSWNDFLKRSGIRIGLFAGYIGISSIIFERSLDEVNEEGIIGADKVFFAFTTFAVLTTFYINTSFQDLRRARKKVHEYNNRLVHSVQFAPVLDPANNIMALSLRLNF